MTECNLLNVTDGINGGSLREIFDTTFKVQL